MKASRETRGAPQAVTREGLASGWLAYLMWGLLPIYFIVLGSVPSLEVLAHRVFWAVPFGALIIAARHQWGEVRAALSGARVALVLFASATLIAVNWFVYIVAVQQGQVFQASLGYYISPLINVLVGVVFFAERLTKTQLAAVLLAAVGVTVLTASGGDVPWVAFMLALSFTMYGIIRKQVSVGAMPGLFVETLFLLPLAGGYLIWISAAGAAAFDIGQPGLSLLLIAAGPVTVLPLLFFALAARGLPLSVLGILQFVAPTLQFLVGLANGETLTAAHVVCFSCIWAAIALFAGGAWYSRRKRRSSAVGV